MFCSSLIGIQPHTIGTLQHWFTYHNDEPFILFSWYVRGQNLILLHLMLKSEEPVLNQLNTSPLNSRLRVKIPLPSSVRCSFCHYSYIIWTWNFYRNSSNLIFFNIKLKEFFYLVLIWGKKWPLNGFTWYPIPTFLTPSCFLTLSMVGEGGMVALSTIFQLYLGGQFYWWGNWSTRRKPPTFHKSLTNFITYLSGIRTYNFSGVHQWHDTCSYRFKFGCRLQLFHCSILVLKPRMINVRVSSLRDLGMRL